MKKRNFLGSSMFLEFICNRNLELVVFCELNYLVFFVSSNLCMLQV